MARVVSPEPTLLDYARFHGLTTNYLARDPLDLLTQWQKTTKPQPVEDEGLPIFDPEAILLTPERLTVDKATVALLSEITSAKDCNVSFDSVVHRSQDLKVELPLLASDHEWDMIEFRQFCSVDLEALVLSMDILDVEEDDGLDWPSKYKNAGTDIIKVVENERLSMGKDAFIWMQRVLEVPVTPLIEPLIDVENGEKICKAMEPLTPILMPRSSELELLIPAAELCELELLPETSSPVRKELETVDRDIWEKDEFLETPIVPDSSNPMLLDLENIGAMYGPLQIIDESTPLSIYRSRRKETGRTRLTGQIVSLGPELNEEQQAFNATLGNALDAMSPLLRPEETTSSDIDTFFAEYVAPVAAQADCEIEQEQLLDIDATGRVPVPIMGCSYTRPPENVTDEAKQSLKTVESQHLIDCEQPIDGKAAQNLQRMPFPANPVQVAAGESFADYGGLDELVDAPPHESVNVSSNFTGLDKCMAASSNSESINRGNSKELTDFNSLLWKRRRDLVLHDSSTEDAVRGHGYELNIRANDGASFAGLGSLDDFLASRSSIYKRRRTGESTNMSLHFHSGSNTTPTAQVQTDPSNGSELLSSQSPAAAQSQTLHKVIERVEEESVSSILVPTLMPANLQPATFILSASLLSSRSLVQGIRKLYPAARLVERDFTTYQSTSPGSGTTYPRTSGIHNEADILLSPSTGLILTTLQQIAQRSLPGVINPHQPLLHQRLTLAAPRYSTLVILVSQGLGRATDMRNTEATITSSDSASLAAFIAFCTSIRGTDVRVSFCAGGEEEFVSWVVHVMVQSRFDGYTCMVDKHREHGKEYARAKRDDQEEKEMVVRRDDQEDEVIERGEDYEEEVEEEESMWELWLRRAGLNAFAAQCVLRILGRSTRAKSAIGSCSRDNCIEKSFNVDTTSTGSYNTGKDYNANTDYNINSNGSRHMDYNINSNGSSYVESRGCNKVGSDIQLNSDTYKSGIGISNSALSMLLRMPPQERMRLFAPYLATNLRNG